MLIHFGLQYICVSGLYYNLQTIIVTVNDEDQGTEDHFLPKTKRTLSSATPITDETGLSLKNRQVEELHFCSTHYPDTFHILSKNINVMKKLIQNHDSFNSVLRLYKKFLC